MSGRWLDLEGPHPLQEALTLEQLRARGPVVQSVLDHLRQRETGSLYFPFFFYRSRELRPMQPSLNKLPSALVAALPELAAAAQVAAATGPLVGAEAASQPAGDARQQIGGAYRQAAVGKQRSDRRPPRRPGAIALPRAMGSVR